MSSLVTMAHKAGKQTNKFIVCKTIYLLNILGLMPNLKPENSTKDPKKRRDWRRFNHYFDESTIKC